MLDIYQWYLVDVVVVIAALFLALWLSDRYFGVSFLGGLVKKKANTFIEQKPLWMQRIIMYLMITIILSGAVLWPTLVVGLQLFNEMLPYLLLFWGFMILLTLITAWGRDEKAEMAIGPRSSAGVE